MPPKTKRKIMSSKIEIWNMALGFIGTRTVASESERCPEAVQCGLFWDNARRMVLSQFPFNFAQKKRLLAEKKIEEVFKSQWKYAYSMPNDCISPQAIADTNNFYERKYFEIALKETGEKVLLCDVNPCTLHYTADVTDTTLYPEIFINALAYKLASLVVIPLLKNNSSKRQELEQLYQMAIADAVQSNARQGKEKPYVDEWIAARY